MSLPLSDFDSVEALDILKGAMPEEINVEQIRNKVMSETSRAEKEILATMDITEEQNSPLPIEYFSLLKQKNEEGVKIRRIIFGSKQQYNSFVQEMNDRKLFFTGKHTKFKNYKRMILIDGAKLFFKKDDKFYFTTDNKYIEEYKKYFNKFK